MNNNVLTQPLTRLGKLGRSFIKRFMYSQLAMRTGFMIAIGKEHPLVQFTVEKDPPSIYWVFRIKPEEVEGLAKKLSIPPQFSLTPIRCLADDEPAYLITLNAYRVSGLAKGIRAEWSIFVKDASDTPRYLIVDARSSQASVDPVSIITKSSFVSHEKTGDTIRTQIGEGSDAFTCTLTLPRESPTAVSSREWVSANDFIYWGNGVCDRTFYNAGLANAKQHRLDGAKAEIKDGTFWGTLVEPEPFHILIYDEAIEFVVSPWQNVDKVLIQE